MNSNVYWRKQSQVLTNIGLAFLINYLDGILFISSLSSLRLLVLSLDLDRRRLCLEDRGDLERLRPAGDRLLVRDRGMLTMDHWFLKQEQEMT